MSSGASSTPRITATIKKIAPRTLPTFPTMRATFAFLIRMYLRNQTKNIGKGEHDTEVCGSYSVCETARL